MKQTSFMLFNHAAFEEECHKICFRCKEVKEALSVQRIFPEAVKKKEKKKAF